LNEKRAYHRTTFFLRKSSQPRLVVGIEIIFLILLIISSAILLLIANRDLTTTYMQAHLKIRNVQDILLPTLVAINVGGLALGAVLVLFYTHRIAGPVYRLCQTLRQIGQGNLSQSVHFRQTDELRELETATTEMVAALRARIARLQALAAQTRALTRAMSGEDTHALENSVCALESELNDFQLGAINSKQAS